MDRARIVVPKDDSVSKRMKGNKSSGTKPELLLLDLLRINGITGFDKTNKLILGKPDVAFCTLRLAVFVHGCFWHQCPYCKLRLPNNNAIFWKEKLTKNKIRDRKVRMTLRIQGWRPLTIWECQLRKNPKRQVDRIIKLVQHRKEI